MGFVQSAKTKKFITEAKNLIDIGTVANYSALAKKLDWDKTAMSNVINGRIDVPARVYEKFMEIYFPPPPPDTKKPDESGLKDELIQSLRDQIDLLRETNQNLRQKLELSLGELRHNILLSRAIGETNQALLIEIVAKQRKMPISEVEPIVGTENGERYKKAKAESIPFDGHS